MGRMMTFGAEELDLGTGAVLFVLSTTTSPNAGCLIRAKRLEVFQNGTTTAEMVRGEFFTRDNAGTLTTTSAAPKNLVSGGPASAFAGNTSVIGGTGQSGYNSSADSGGAYTQLKPFNFHNLNGLLWVPTNEQEIWVPASQFFGWRFLVAPSSALDWGFSFDFEEVI